MIKISCNLRSKRNKREGGSLHLILSLSLKGLQLTKINVKTLRLRGESFRHLTILQGFSTVSEFDFLAKIEKLAAPMEMLWKCYFWQEFILKQFWDKDLQFNSWKEQMKRWSKDTSTLIPSKQQSQDKILSFQSSSIQHFSKIVLLTFNVKVEI